MVTICGHGLIAWPPCPLYMALKIIVRAFFLNMKLKIEIFILNLKKKERRKVNRFLFLILTCGPLIFIFSPLIFIFIKCEI